MMKTTSGRFVDKPAPDCQTVARRSPGLRAGRPLSLASYGVMKKLLRGRSGIARVVPSAFLAIVMACGSDKASGPSLAAGDSVGPTHPPPSADTLTAPDTVVTPDSVTAPDSTPGPDSLPPPPDSLPPPDPPPPDSLPPTDSLPPEPRMPQAPGMPFGFFRQPHEAIDATYNSAKQNMAPRFILGQLERVRARGGRVFVMLADVENWYKDRNGHFSLDKWKARIDRYRGVDFSSYIRDGTIIAHFMIDEPQDKTNWNGVPLTAAQMEEMAKYSKQLWPEMATIVRAAPPKLVWSGTYRYLDAAWAQVENVRGTLNIDQFLEENVSLARKLGLALVVGLNVSKGNLNRSTMTPAQIKSWGSTLMSSSYPCAFISWKYDAAYLAQREIKEALGSLAEKARNRPRVSCATK